jgi:hypothetical protein
VARAQFSTTVLDPAGNVLAAQPLALYEPDGATPLGQAVYDAPSGGTVITAPQTDGDGQLRLYADAGQYVTYRVASGELEHGRIDPDPGQVVVLSGPQTLTDKTLAAPILTGLTLFDDAAGSGDLSLDGAATLGALVVPRTAWLKGDDTGAGGLWLDDAGYLGLFDSATGANGFLPTTNTYLSATVSDSLNMVAYDWQYRSNYPGVTGQPASTGTVGAASTLGAINDLTKSWTVNQWTTLDTFASSGVLPGRTWFMTLVSGTGAGQTRLVTGNTATQITVSPDFTGPIDTTTGYQIVAAGDMGASRTLMERKPGSIASARAAEFHAWAHGPGAADSGVIALEMSIGSDYAQRDYRVNNVGISLGAYDAWFGAGTGVRQGTGIRLWGSNGWTYFLRGESTAGADEVLLRNGGHAEFLGNVVAGSVAAGTARLTVKQSLDNHAGGARFVQSAGPNFLAAFMGAAADEGGCLHTVVGAEQGLMRLGAKSAESTLLLSALTAHTGPLLELRSPSGVRHVVLESGAVQIQGVTVLSTQQVGQAALTISAGTPDNVLADVTASFNQTLLNNNFADLATKINGIRTILNAHGLTTTV